MVFLSGSPRTRSPDFADTSYICDSFGALLVAPRQTAVVAYWARSHSRLVTSEINTAPYPVIELVAGTGAFTRVFLERGVPEDRLVVVEVDATCSQGRPTILVLSIERSAFRADRHHGFPRERLSAACRSSRYRRGCHGHPRCDLRPTAFTRARSITSPMGWFVQSRGGSSIGWSWMRNGSAALRQSSAGVGLSDHATAARSGPPDAERFRRWHPVLHGVEAGQPHDRALVLAPGGGESSRDPGYRLQPGPHRRQLGAGRHPHCKICWSAP